MKHKRRYPEAFRFQDLLDAQLEEYSEHNSLIKKILLIRFQELKINLNEEEILALEKSIKNLIESGKFNFDLDDKHLESSHLNESDLNERVTNVIKNLDADIERAFTALITTFEKIIADLSVEISNGVNDSLNARSKKTLEHIQKETKAFETRLRKFWSESLDWLEVLIGVSMEAGELIVKTNIDSNQNNKGTELISKLDVLITLHARACQIASEILALLRTGFADGAHARWRSLHEVSVIAIFISQQPESVAIKYFHHQDIENLRHIESELHRFPSLKADKKALKLHRDLVRSTESLIAVYGVEFKTDYGWAAQTLNKKKPTFRDIEAAVEIDSLRSSYKLASLNVHGSAKGTFERLGAPLSLESRLLSGRSDFGLEQAGELAAVSLGYLTICLLTVDPTLDMIICSQSIALIMNEVKQSFKKSTLKLNRQIKKDSEISKTVRKFVKVR